jgi:serine/threonine protein kinase
MTKEDLFRAALAKPPAERAAFLERGCTGRPQLRAAVEALLAAHEEVPPHLVPTTDYCPLTEPGTVIAGRYALQEKIGEGGMGEVWAARQTEPVKRRVAVKLIRVERGSSKTILSRFEAERQAIALMDHPHIARLFDAGTTDSGSPFFVMELVKGSTLTEYCDAQRLTIPERLKLFVSVCQAVQHAHQKGIIHRDLKPSNVLVESHDGKPTPKVIDFGLAKATSGLQLTEQSLATAFGSVMGTPLYMAPEQAGGNALDVDTRADVYALGVILYELLTGTTPITRGSIKKAAIDEVLRLVREQEPPPPSSRLSTSKARATVAANRQTDPARLGRFVRGDLDWIVMKALSKERDRRYETANGLARDVERFLSDEPVTAGPPSASYRLKKFIRRHRGPVVAAALVLLTLLAGIAGTTYGLIQARQEQAVARAERDQKGLALVAEQKAKVRAREALDEMTSKVIEDWLAKQRDLTPGQKLFLEKALAWYQEFAADAGDDPATRAGVAQAHSRAGNILQRLGRHRDALASYRRAEELYRALEATPDNRRLAAAAMS